MSTTKTKVGCLGNKKASYYVIFVVCKSGDRSEIFKTFY